MKYIDKSHFTTDIKIMFSFIEMKVLVKNKAIFIMLLAVSFVYINNADAQDSGKSYYDAYNLCTPVAHRIARSQCGYGRVFEHYYLQCMKGRGYADENNLDPDYYEGYLAAYEQCNSIADSNTKQYCNYGGLYSAQYHKCMAGYGFDSQGNKINQPQQHFKFDF